jgi:hypothetical protein
MVEKKEGVETPSVLSNLAEKKVVGFIAAKLLLYCLKQGIRMLQLKV